MTNGSDAKQRETGKGDGEFAQRGTDRLRDTFEANVNDLYDRYRDPQNRDILPTLGFFLQVSMFHYEMARELASLSTNSGSGFAQALAVKGMIHRAVEFEKHLRNALIPQMHQLAAHFKADLPRQKTRDLQRRFKPEIAQVLRWERIRNKATGHYDSDIALVVSLLDGLTYQQVIETVQGFIQYTGNLLALFERALHEVPSKSR
ncbi:hypothetical protein [Burkholderia ubonensis]|uniref:hypothetical protein n=1 Tax=Burkholderia ubonensis TaxID=101571 RepID=UPI0012F826FD|nr:hypothetical protein [Burkholderia ubonensis]